MSATAPAPPAAAARSRALVLWVLWATYGAFYFGRTNISSALPGIEHELGIGKAELGWVLASFKIAYAAGQIVNGQLAERVSARKLLAAGMFGSAALCVVFGLHAGVGFWLFVWACNGYAQALGWTPTMRVAAAWIPPRDRGVQLGILGTSYQVTAAATFVLAGWAADAIGWRGAMAIPAALLALAGVHMLLLLREAPASDERDGGHVEDARLPLRQAIRDTVSNPSLWLLALALGLLNATRYGFLDWGLSHVKEMQASGVGAAATKYAVLPLGGIAGALFSGWASDRFARGRRAPVVIALLVILATLTVAYQEAASAGTVAVVATLLLVGAAIFGAQVLLVGAFPVDLARPGTTAASVGFVNCMGYVGAAAGDVATGVLVERHGWRTAVYAWAGYALLAAVLLVPLWRRGRAAPTAAAG